MKTHNENKGQEDFTLEFLVSFVVCSNCWALGQEILTPKQGEELQIKFTTCQRNTIPKGFVWRSNSDIQ